MGSTLPPVQVEGGLIQGLPSPLDPGITIYKGVPYAAPPTGANRFKPPQPIIPWDNVRVCDTIGPVCPQAPPDPRYPNVLKGHPQSEDCLYLNVYQPSNDLETERPYPVYVWYHGGGFREGGSADPNFDGTGLAQKGVIVVVPSFRLSVFGYFAHPELSAESPSGTSGMVGMLDAVEVLKWVRSNISIFGGNPNQVTIGGQSAGNAMSHTLLSSPLAKGLLHGVILQSGPRSFQEPALANGPMSYRTLKEAEEDGVQLLNELGLKNVEEFRNFDDLDKLREVSTKRDWRYWGPPPLFRLILDGYVIPKPWSEIHAGEPPNDVPVMAGMNSEEGGTYNEPRFTYEDFLDCVEGRLGPNSTYGRGKPAYVEQFHELYPLRNRETGQGPLETWNQAARDNTRNNIALWAQEYHQKTRSAVYGYYFTHPITPWRNWQPDHSQPKVPGFTNQKGPVGGAYHGAEFAYTFNSLITNDLRPWTETDRVIGEKVSALWANFIKYGNPNGLQGASARPEGVAEWPSLVDQPDTLLELGGEWQTIKTVDDPARARFWTNYIRSQRAW
ncbi:catalytic protein [Aspergillus indologenus CBS 114.80]|uniref:Carboxylic ester hydrolase n=1 Tax=Aspergillus indologenus CBS 114.80 TaxID=1450541 RepID=A0A2V5HR98_9EURO|nr:catalytic protein [Aspergillus indologenus CBS 114.80]